MYGRLGERRCSAEVAHCWTAWFAVLVVTVPTGPGCGFWRRKLLLCCCVPVAWAACGVGLDLTRCLPALSSLVV